MILRERTATVEMSTLKSSKQQQFFGFKTTKPIAQLQPNLKRIFLNIKKIPPLDINKTKFNKSPIHLGFFYFVGTPPPALKEKCY